MRIFLIIFFISLGINAFACNYQFVEPVDLSKVDLDFIRYYNSLFDPDEIKLTITERKELEKFFREEYVILLESFKKYFESLGAEVRYTSVLKDPGMSIDFSLISSSQLPANLRLLAESKVPLNLSLSKFENEYNAQGALSVGINIEGKIEVDLLNIYSIKEAIEIAQGSFPEFFKHELRHLRYIKEIVTQKITPLSLNIQGNEGEARLDYSQFMSIQEIFTYPNDLNATGNIIEKVSAFQYLLELSKTSLSLTNINKMKFSNREGFPFAEGSLGNDKFLRVYLPHEKSLDQEGDIRRSIIQIKSYIDEQLNLVDQVLKGEVKPIELKKKANKFIELFQ